MQDINNLFSVLDELEQQEQSYKRDIAIADIFSEIEKILQ